MLFKNAIIYQITKPMQSLLEDFQDQLKEFQFEPCKSQELARMGWAKPKEILEDLFCEVDGAYLLTAKREDKILPAAVINAATDEVVANIEKTEGRKVYRKERLSIKDEVILDKLPQAFSKFTRANLLILPKANLIVVEATNYSKAEDMLSLLRNTLGSLPICLPDVNSSPAAIFSEWVSNETGSGNFVVGEKCKLSSACGTQEKITFANVSLSSDEVLSHLENSMQVTELAINWADTLSFKLLDNMTIKQIKPLDVFSEQVEEEMTDSELLGLKSDILIISKTFKQLTSEMYTAFGGLVKRKAA